MNKNNSCVRNREIRNKLLWDTEVQEKSLKLYLLECEHALLSLWQLLSLGLGRHGCFQFQFQLKVSNCGLYIQCFQIIILTLIKNIFKKNPWKRQKTRPIHAYTFSLDHRPKTAFRLTYRRIRVQSGLLFVL